MSYSKNQVESHIKAAKLLEKIVKEVFQYIKSRKNCAEYEVQQFILGRFDYYRLATDKGRTPIVAFGQSTSNVHYYPPKTKSRKLKPNSLIMIDVWARLDKKKAVFADITWMGYYGKKAPADTQKIYDLVITARDQSIKHIKSSLQKGIMPQGKAADLAARDIISREGHGHRFVHTTGHSLGLDHPHGAYIGINTKNRRKLKAGIPYTIEPGVYLKGKFGVRSEINFYITSDFKLKLTTKCQKNIVYL